MRTLAARLTLALAALLLAGCSTLQPAPAATPTLALPTQSQPTQTPAVIAASATPQIIIEEAPQDTPMPTEVLAQPSPTAGEPAAGGYPAPLELTPVAVENPIYQAQPGTPRRVQNFARPEQGCNLTAVAGQVLDASGAPVPNLVIQVGGTLNDRPVNALGLTGSAPAYGPGGYEVVLASEALESAQTLWLQVLDLSGAPLSDPVPFDTQDDCLRNLVLINFVPAQ